MRLNWRRSSRTEDRFEAWLLESHQRRVLAGETVPIGSCPDESFLYELAHKSRHVRLSDPRVDHAANCPRCMRRLLGVRTLIESRRRKTARALAIAFSIALALALIGIARLSMHKRLPTTEMVLRAQTINLSDAGTLRGEQPNTIQSVSLPAAMVRLTIALPRFSPTGQYLVVVTKDQIGNGVQADGTAGAVQDGSSVEITVDLDLRKAKAGRYYLSTTHAKDQATYYYPLQIQ